MLSNIPTRIAFRMEVRPDAPWTDLALSGKIRAGLDAIGVARYAEIKTTENNALAAGSTGVTVPDPRGLMDAFTALAKDYPDWRFALSVTELEASGASMSWTKNGDGSEKIRVTGTTARWPADRKNTGTEHHTEYAAMATVMGLALAMITVTAIMFRVLAAALA